MEKNLLLIGGASRNVGKTTFLCRLINRFSDYKPIIGLKIKTIYDGDNFFHGKDRSPLKTNYRLIEEFNKTSNEDTSKMLQAGATRAFKLKVKSYALKEALESFKNCISRECLIVCESNSLRRVVRPAVYLLIKHETQLYMKPSALELEKYADLVISTDGELHNFSLDNLVIEDGSWKLK